MNEDQQPLPPEGGGGERPSLERSETELKLPEDRDEPRSLLGVVPVGLIVFFGILFYWGMLYLDRHAGGFNAQVYEPYQSLALIPRPGPVTEEQMMAVRGRRVYDTCVGCHAPTGMGGSLAPALAGSEWVIAPEPDRLIRIVLHGLEGPIMVKGELWGPPRPTTMPPLGILSDEDIAAVLTYIRQAWGNQAPPVYPDDVARVRQETADRQAAWTEPELLQIPVGN
jgi:mono/diheme cytochrome c family protein